MMQELLDELTCSWTEKTGKRLGSLKHAGTRTFGRLVWVADEAVSVTSSCRARCCSQRFVDTNGSHKWHNAVGAVLIDRNCVGKTVI